MPPGSITTFDLKKNSSKGSFTTFNKKKLPVPPGSFTPASQKTHSTKQIHRVESSHTLTLKKKSAGGIHTHIHKTKKFAGGNPHTHTPTFKKNKSFFWLHTQTHILKNKSARRFRTHKLTKTNKPVAYGNRQTHTISHSSYVITADTP